ncbi:MAG: hypothetical protein IJJ01_11570 [Firmicutes bacterium]|nr:hypothetical protein [Bacillota bacterium]
MADQKYSRDPNKKTQKERIQEISEELERGVQSMFESEQYKKWLDVCSRFHNYSLNNTILITMQRPDASYVGGYAMWKKLGRSVKKGEHGIRILAPYKYKVEVEDSDGDKQIIEKTGFKPAYVFDYSQTEGKELLMIGVNELTGDVKDYRRLYRALTEISPVPIRFEDIQGGAKGYYNDAEKSIAIQSGMSQLQTIKTLVHEICHSQNHSKEALKERAGLDRRTMEVESESVAHIVLKTFSLDSEDYSIPYISSWSSGKDTRELKACMESIRSTADEMITGINKSLDRQKKREHRELDMER